MKPEDLIEALTLMKDEIKSVKETIYTRLGEQSEAIRGLQVALGSFHEDIQTREALTDEERQRLWESYRKLHKEQESIKSEHGKAFRDVFARIEQLEVGAG